VNFAYLLLDNINKYGEYMLLNYEDQEYTNTDLERLSNRLGRGLLKMGLQKDDRVVVFLPNIPEVLISYLAILKVGAIVVPVNPSLSPQELSYIINDSEPLMIITSTGLAETVRRAQELSLIKPSVIVAGKSSHQNARPIADCYMEDNSFLMIERPDEAIAIIMYSSGTTGKPKGAMLSHLNLRLEGYGDAQQIGLIDPAGNRQLEKVNLLGVLPFSHVYGLCTMAVAYLSGGTIFLMPEFDPGKTLKCIQENEITVFGGVPTMYTWLAAYPDAENYDTSSVVRWISGAAALPAEVRNSFEKRYNTKILDAYGLTETASGFSMQRYDRPIKPGSVGPAMPGCEVRVVDNEGRPLPPGQVGELTIKGPNVMKGYYRNEEETAQALKDGWLYTGDIGYMDEDGDIFIVDRKKDLIIRGGFSVYPSEVEAVLCDHPEISDVGVIGVPDREYGEQVCAFVVLKEGAKVSKKEIQSFCRENLAGYKIPRHIEFCDSLPKNELGKTLRRQLRAALKDLVVPF